MPAHAPRDNVLENPELLELVLLQLDLRTLVCAQRVCLRWRGAARSPALQEALFLRPARAAAATSTSTATASSATGTAPPPVVVNPLLMLHFPAWFAPRRQWKERYELEAGSWTRDPAARDKFLRPEASWKFMLPVQPPPRALRVVTRSHVGALRVRKGRLVMRGKGGGRQGNGGGSDVVEATGARDTVGVAVWNGEDVQMGLIYHLAQTYLRERVVSYFCMVYPEDVQRVLDEPLEGMLPSPAYVASSPAGAERQLLSDAALRSIEEEQAGTNTMTMVFEQLRNWFEAHDPTGNWLEEQNAIFARLNLRSWRGPVIWDEGAIEWQADEEDG